MPDRNLPSLVELVKAASGVPDPRGRLAALDGLWVVSVRQRDAHALCELVRSDVEPAWRATAAQTLGFHGCSERFSEVRRELAKHLTVEPDLIVAKSIAFALAGTRDAWTCLEVRKPAVQAEGMLGVLLDLEEDWFRALNLYFTGLPTEVEAIFLRRSGSDPDAPAHAVAFLLTAPLEDCDTDPADRAAVLFRAMDQGALLSALALPEGGFARTYREIWPGLVRRERRQVLMELLEEDVRARGASLSLVQALVGQAVASPDSGIGLRKLAHRLIEAFDEQACRRFVAEVRSAAPAADVGGLRALSELLVALIRTSPAAAGEAEAVLSEWEGRLPGMRLKAFHARLGSG